ncbi:MAG: hypothetical protein ACI9N9_001615, partial [Enterobacterales bacterium]
VSFAADKNHSNNEETKAVKYSDLKKAKAVSTGDQVYTWIDESGNRMYSDMPRDGAELMKIQEGTNYSPPGQKSNRDYSTMRPKVVETGDSYTNFSIISPSNSQTIRNNNGDFQVAIDVRPKLGKGHGIRLEIDGQVVQSSMSSLMSLANIDRGTHTLVAYITGADGKTIKTTAPVTIHLHRAH